MDTRTLWSRILTVVGGLAMVVGAIDPMEGSLLILPGSGLLALGARLGQGERRVIASRISAFILIAVGIGALWGLSVAGGFGGSTGRSAWWGLLILPYLIGWLMGMCGPGAPRWLARLGVAVGGWWLCLAFKVAGGVGIACGIIGVLTVIGCIGRLIVAASRRDANHP